MSPRYAVLLIASLAVTIGLDALIAWGSNGRFPLTYVVQENGFGTLSMTGFVFRALAYLVLGGAILINARVTAMSIRWNAWLWTAVTALLSWTFWFIVDPTALAHVLSRGSWESYVGFLTAHAPNWADLYTGWGYVRHFWWLAVIHGVLVVFMVIIGSPGPRDRDSYSQAAG